MKYTQQEFEYWVNQLENEDPDEKNLALNKLFQMNYPQIQKILIKLAESKNNEKVRIEAIRLLGNLELTDKADIFKTFKQLLIKNSPAVRKATLKAIVKSSDISAIRYLTKYYYSKYSEGVKEEVNQALEAFLKNSDNKNSKVRLLESNKKLRQKGLTEESLKSKDDIDYKKNIKKYFDE
ncbi:MAG: HEAT repeat domain-containing protein [Candidatus Helarchaeota archaeon]